MAVRLNVESINASTWQEVGTHAGQDTGPSKGPLESGYLAGRPCYLLHEHAAGSTHPTPSK